MKNNEMKPCELALDNLHKEVRNAILNGVAEMDICPSENDYYFAEVKVKLGRINFSMTVAETLICYHNNLMQGLFDNLPDFRKFKDMLHKHVKTLTKEDIEKIKSLNEQIEAIKRGQA